MVVSNLGRVKRLRRNVTSSVGAFRTYNEKILRPNITTHYVYDSARYHHQLTAKVHYNRCHHIFYPAKMVYYLFNNTFPIHDPNYIIGFKNGNDLDFRPENLSLHHLPNGKGAKLGNSRKFSILDKMRLLNKAELDLPVIRRKNTVSCYNSKGNLVRTYKDWLISLHITFINIFSAHTPFTLFFCFKGVLYFFLISQTSPASQTKGH